MTTETDLAQLHAVIVSTIQAQFPGLETVEFYGEDRESMTVPACLLNLIDFEAGDDPGTEQAAVVCRFEAQLVLGFRDTTPKLAARVLAGQFAAFLRSRSRWPGVPQAGGILFANAHRDDFSPELDKYEVWRVEWSQELHLGASVWTNDGVIPTIVLTSWSPDIGAAHEADYVQVIPTGIPEA